MSCKFQVWENFRRALHLGTYQIAAGIDTQEDEKKEGEAPERGTTIAEERQRDTNDGRQAEHHADIDKDVEEEDAQNTVAVDTPEGVRLAFRQVNEA